MASTDELDSRVEGLERELRDLSRVRKKEESSMSRISLLAWLQITGPTFATMVFGFALLWNAQQATSAQVLDVARGMGRLEGSIDGVERSVEGVERSLTVLNARLDRLGDSVERLAERVGADRS
jgi:hypothetical protein